MHLHLDLSITGPAYSPSGPVLDISAFNYDSADDYHYGGETGRLREIAVSPDGTKIIAIDNAKDKILEYTMSTPWEPSTISLTREVKMSTLGNGEVNPQAIFVSPDGLRLYYSGNLHTIFEWSMSTPWDISTLADTGRSYFIGRFLLSFTMSYDGVYLYMSDDTISANAVRQYEMTTPWNISTVTSTSKFTEIITVYPGPSWISTDGKHYVVAEMLPDIFRQFSLGTPFDISTLSDTGKTLDYAADTTGGETHCSGVWLSDALDVLILAGGTEDYIFKFSK